MNSCVVIPAYNEAGEISRLIRQIQAQQIPLIVVDDGSSDATAKIAQDLGVTVMRNAYNEGKGVSLRRGFCRALTDGFAAVITLDADGQHDPLDIPLFTQLAENSPAGIIIGNRMTSSKGMPLLRFLTNRFMSWFISRLVQQEIPDTQCGFRLIKQEVLKKISLQTRKFEIESEIIFSAARGGFKIASIPIRTIYRNEKSQIDPLADTLRFIRFIFRQLFVQQ
jgi:glycosyltransferase involved in cell wall biosynthesis